MAPDRPIRPDALEWRSPVTPEVDAELRAEGRSMVRLLHQMRVALPLAPAVVAATRPIAVRPFVAGSDDDAWLAVNNAAFAWHPDQGGWDRPRLHTALSEPWVRTDGFLVHDATNPDQPNPARIDGFCWTKEHPAHHDGAHDDGARDDGAHDDGAGTADPAMGEIYVIAADPSTAGTGLGGALTVAGLNHLHSRGLRVGMLYVEAINTPALRLYERLGFVVHHSKAAYTTRTM